jgi:hypothetical protein
MTVNDLLIIIGDKEVEIYRLKAVIKALEAKLGDSAPNPTV